MKPASWHGSGALAAALLGAAGLTLMTPAIGADGATRPTFEVRSVSAFDRITIDAPAELLLTQGGAESLMVEAEGRVLPLLRTHIDDGTLVIGVAGSMQTTVPIHVRVTVRTLAVLRANGNAAVQIGALRTPALAMQLAGSSHARVAQLNASRFDPQLAGSSELQVQGQVLRQQVKVGEAARYDASGLRSDETQIDVRGSGEALVHAEHHLDAQVSDSGRLSYHGAPQLTQRVQDAAELRRMGVAAN